MSALLFLALAVGATGPELVARFECQRCHDGLPQAPVINDQHHCVHCHQAIEAGTFAAPAELQAEWRGHLVSLRVAPSLADLGRQLRPEWIEAFLQAPRDLRPNLLATMPRLAISPSEARTLARYLGGAPSPPPGPQRFEPAQVEAGRRRFLALGCPSCHAYSGALPRPPPLSPADLRSAGPALLLAPDLATTRERIRPEILPQLLTGPRALRETATMPDFALEPEAIAELSAFVMAAPLEPTPPPPEVARLPLLTRAVRFGEIKREIFQKHCRHCHADPEKAFGDGGPGNSGGLGYRGRSLSLVDYRSVQTGGRDDQGRRRSIFRPLADGTPRLLGHLLARRSEERGKPVEGLLGMPLGLPSLSPEELQLLETWIAQGRLP